MAAHTQLLMSPRELEELSNAERVVGQSQGVIRPLFTIVHISPWIGMGLKARRFIPKGTMIFEEEKLFSIPNLSDPPSAENIAHIAAAANQFPQFQQLSCPGGPNVQTPALRFQTNSFMMSQTGNVTEEGVFETAARINHSCVPNACFDYSNDLQRLTIYAIFDIESNQEILVNYRAKDFQFFSRAQRRTVLLQDYHFTCQCKACKLNTAAHLASEAYRPRMQNLHTAIMANAGSNVAAVRGQRIGSIQALRNLFGLEANIYPGM